MNTLEPKAGERVRDVTFTDNTFSLSLSFRLVLIGSYLHDPTIWFSAAER